VKSLKKKKKKKKSNIKALILGEKEYLCNIFLYCTLFLHVIFLEIMQTETKEFGRVSQKP
jgi:hypothetical protein